MNWDAFIPGSFGGSAKINIDAPHFQWLTPES
jgi:hypothetical protein